MARGTDRDRFGIFSRGGGKAGMAEALTPDICVVGGGPGGIAAALAAAAEGVPVVLVERAGMGGSDLASGTIPSKALVAAAGIYEALRLGPVFGVTAAPLQVNLGKVREHIEAVTGEVSAGVSAERLTALGVTAIAGEARFRDRRTLSAGERLVRPRRVILAVGSQPSIPAVPGLDTVEYMTPADGGFDLSRRPAHLIILGADRHALELAQAHNRLGIDTTVVAEGPALADDDPELAALVVDRLRAEGIRVRLNLRIVSVARRKGGIRFLVVGADERDADAAAGEIAVDGSHLLVVAGRRPNVDDLGLGAAGIQYDGSGIAVDRQLRTTNRRVYAIGDAVAGPASAARAEYQAGRVVNSILYRWPFPDDPGAVPAVVFTDPGLASVGLSEERGPATARRRPHAPLSVRRERSRPDRAATGRRDQGRGGPAGPHPRRGDRRARRGRADCAVVARRCQPAALVGDGGARYSASDPVGNRPPRGGAAGGRFDAGLAAAHHRTPPQIRLICDARPTGQGRGERRTGLRAGRASSPCRSRAERGATRRGASLSVRLFALAVLFVTVTEVFIYVPSVANFRITWLADRLTMADAASVVIAESTVTDIPRDIQDGLLNAVGAIAIAVRTGTVSRLIATVEMPPAIDEVVDLNAMNPIGDIGDAFATLIAGEPRILRVIGSSRAGNQLELVISDRALRAAMLRYSANILWLSLLVSVIAGGLLYFAINRLFVRPMRRLTENMVAFSAAPEDTSRVIAPSGRGDEIGIAEEHLATMQQALQGTLREQRHLADLGLAVSKINHDLRNMLAAAQLFSDRLGSLPDPNVQRFAPKLIATLDRAIAYCTTTLAYGRAREAAPARRLVALAFSSTTSPTFSGLPGIRRSRSRTACRRRLEIDADPDQLFRVLVNLCRNAVQALEGGDPTRRSSAASSFPPA
jgi:pyruvate/2-oxoglutarate dehydrogenase complex dihydrolipoamide dehydrogenase (E3) component/signal transduction histidine kinase